MPDDLTVNSKELRDNNATTNECSVNALIKSLICPPCNVNERKRSICFCLKFVFGSKFHCWDLLLLLCMPSYKQQNEYHGLHDKCMLSRETGFPVTLDKYLRRLDDEV
ncbi:hypothetical protein GQX74_011417 [Glossina fuscipes]|nr:hypothetical protein GQX74_011417 [Glossina fuscipes]